VIRVFDMCGLLGWAGGIWKTCLQFNFGFEQVTRINYPIKAMFISTY
jgi:hypothetical protein